MLTGYSHGLLETKLIQSKDRAHTPTHLNLTMNTLEALD